MAIEFFNIRSGERRVVTSEPMIAAFYNSGDQHENSRKGQDFKWRIGASTLKRMQDIREDQVMLDRIAQKFNLPQGEVSDTSILYWISLEDARAEAEADRAEEQDYSRQYEEEVRAELEGSGTSTPQPQPKEEDAVEKVSRARLSKQPENQTGSAQFGTPQDLDPGSATEEGSASEDGNGKMEESTDTNQ